MKKLIPYNFTKLFNLSLQIIIINFIQIKNLARGDRAEILPWLCESY